MKKIILMAAVFLIFSGCSLKTDYGTATLTLTPAQIAYLYDQYMNDGARSAMVVSLEGVQVVVDDPESE